jgi:hypothetical protein
MNPVKPTNSKWMEIRAHGLLGRQLEPVFKGQNGKWLALVGLAILGVTFYWTFTYSGPYRSLAELQLKWFAYYGEELTALLVFSGLVFGMLAIAVAIKFLFRGAERPLSKMQTAPMATPVLATPAIPAPAVQVPERWLQSCRLAVMYVTPFLVGGVGAYSYYNGTHEGSLQQLSAVDFESGKVQARAFYADVHGHLSELYISNDSYRYIPMLGEEKAAGPVRLMVGISDDDVLKYLHREADGTFTVRGVTDKGLPSDLRYAFEKNGIAVADPVWVVHAGREPSWDRQTGLLIMGVGIALASFVFGWQAYRKQKGGAAQAARASA